MINLTFLIWLKKGKDNKQAYKNINVALHVWIIYYVYGT